MADNSPRSVSKMPFSSTQLINLIKDKNNPSNQQSQSNVKQFTDETHNITGPSGIGLLTLDSIEDARESVSSPTPTPMEI